MYRLRAPAEIEIVEIIVPIHFPNNKPDKISSEIKYKDGTSKTIKVLCRIDTQNEVEYYKNGGTLQYVLRNMLN